MGVFKNIFIALSNNKYLNDAAKQVGPRMGANKVVAGNTIPQLIETIEYLNENKISVTVDNLGNLLRLRKKAKKLKKKSLK